MNSWAQFFKIGSEEPSIWDKDFEQAFKSAKPLFISMVWEYFGLKNRYCAGGLVILKERWSVEQNFVNGR